MATPLSVNQPVKKLKWFPQFKFADQVLSQQPRYKKWHYLSKFFNAMHYLHLKIATSLPAAYPHSYYESFASKTSPATSAILHFPAYQWTEVAEKSNL